MKYTRFTNMSFEKAVNSNQSEVYKRLALLEDCIDNGELVYRLSILTVLEEKRHSLEENLGNPETIATIKAIEKKFKKDA